MNNNTQEKFLSLDEALQETRDIIIEKVSEIISKELLKTLAAFCINFNSVNAEIYNKLAKMEKLIISDDSDIAE